jgi:hypothetical protein
MPGKRWSPSLRDDLALAVARGVSIPRWSKERGVPERTCFEWSGKPAFKQAVDAHRRRLNDQMLGRLVQHGTRAVERLRRLADRAQSEAVQLGAAREILAQIVHISGFSEIERRLIELERLYAERSQKADNEA